MAFLFLLLVIPIHAVAQPTSNPTPWERDPAINTIICTQPGYQTSPSIVPDGQGGAIMIWLDTRDGSGGSMNYDLYAQRIDNSGTIRWEAQGVAVSKEIGFQLDPDIVPDGEGGAFIAWADERNTSSSGTDIYAQHIDANGSAAWTIDGIPVCTSPNDQRGVKIISDGAGGAIVSWTEQNAIFAQRIDPAGSLVWTASGVQVALLTQPKTKAPLADENHTAVIASDGGKGVIVVWMDGIGEAQTLYAQKIDSVGNAAWTEGGVNVLAPGAENPQILVDNSGAAIIVWRTQTEVANDIQAQRLNALGEMLWGESGISVCAAEGGQRLPVIAHDGNGGILVAWNDMRHGNETPELYVQRIDDEGVPQWTTDGVHIASLFLESYPQAIIADGSGGAIVAWASRVDENQSDIYAQKLSAEGEILWPRSVPVSTAVGAQYEPVGVSDGEGGAVITWTDNRGNGDIYAHHVDALGTIQIKVTYQGKWNLVSAPVDASDNLATSIFPDAVSEAFAFSNDGYQSTSELSGGRGYWMKFDAQTEASVYGRFIERDTVPMSVGWNIIGSISEEVAVEEITSVPSGLVTSQFFGYSSGYSQVNVIESGKAYWVKAQQEGSLVLTSTAPSPGQRIRIIPTHDLPPDAPGPANSQLPPAFRLEQNSPNPFNPSTTISYRLAEDGLVRLTVFDVLGREIATLVDEDQQAGEHSVTFEAGEIPTGIYLYRIVAGASTDWKKMAVVR